MMHRPNLDFYHYPHDMPDCLMDACAFLNPDFRNPNPPPPPLAEAFVEVVDDTGGVVSNDAALGEAVL